MEELQKLNSIIDIDKEILSTLPKNNKKNKTAYLNKVNEIKDEFKEIKVNILSEIKIRYNKIIDVHPNQKIDEIREELQSNENVQYLINDIDTAYEKMDLDKGLVNLEQYQRKDLKDVNENIAYCIDRFKQVGINLEQKDFDYSNFVNEYLSVFFDEMEIGDINSKNIKDKFDEIYWQCPDLIIQIALNFKYLYLKYEQKITKYFTEQRSKLLKKHTGEEIRDRFMDLQKELEVATSLDGYSVFQRLLNKELSTKDFTEKSIIQRYEMFVSEEKINLSDEQEMNEIDSNLKKLLNGLYEYKKYLEFKFIIDEVKQIYEKNEKVKSSYEKIKRQILMKEKNRIRINLKISKQNTSDNSYRNNLTQREGLINELKGLYDELDENKIIDMVTKKLNPNSTIYDVIDLVGSFYEFLYSFILKAKENIEDEEIDKLIDDINEFRKFPYCTIMKNISVSDERDIAIMIKEMYQLLGINISSDLNEDDIDGIIDILNKMMISHNIRKNKIDISTIDSALEFKTIIKNNTEQN